MFSAINSSAFSKNLSRVPYAIRNASHSRSAPAMLGTSLGVPGTSDLQAIPSFFLSRFAESATPAIDFGALFPTPSGKVPASSLSVDPLTSKPYGLPLLPRPLPGYSIHQSHYLDFSRVAPALRSLPVLFDQ